MSPTVFRDATPADLVLLRDLCRSSIRELGTPAYGREQLDAWASFTLDPHRFRAFVLDHGTLVAELDGVPAGFAGMGDDGHIVSVFVAPEHARRGIARALLERLMERARARGIRRFHADVSLVAHPVFVELGFRSEGTETVIRSGVSLARHRMVLDEDAS